MTNVLTIPSRFNGPAASATAATSAAGSPRTSTAPPRSRCAGHPRWTPRWRSNATTRARSSSGTARTLIGEAAPSPAGPPEIAVTVSPAEADAAAGGARYFTDPVFSRLLRLRDEPSARGRAADLPGPVTGLALWAAPWTPDPSVAGPDGRGAGRGGLGRARLSQRDRRRRGGRTGRRIRLGHRQSCSGRMTATTLAARPAVGDQCRVIAWPQRRDGRKLTAGSALLGPGGEVLALAEAVWLTVPRPGQARAVEAAEGAR